MTDNTPILVADIGGTNARFSLADTDGKLIPECLKVVATADYDSLQDAANAYLETSTRPRPKLAAIAIAAFIAHDTIQMTNCPWTFKKSALATDLHVERVNILNDFEAIACALPVLNDTDLQQIGGSEIDITGNKVVIGPGTGVGVACLTPVGDGWKVITSEGGHISFAPVNDLEHDILRTVKKLYPRVSVERIISGQGLSTLYQALSTLQGKPTQQLNPSQITENALKNPTGNCRKVADLFCNILGSFAGDMAVTFNATGGLYLAGGVLPNIMEIFHASLFRERFEEKGRLSFVKNIPVLQIQERQPALVGLAAHAQGKFY